MRVLVFGAHPDDAEFHAAGLLAIHAARGSTVRLVSVSDGSAGHHSMPRSDLAKRRLQEAERAAAVIGADVEVWQVPDGEIEPTLPLRTRVIESMRSFAPDLVLTHRTADYHPDHRAVASLVRDACYMVRVPNVAPSTPPLRADPVVATFADFFSLPSPFRADACIDIEPVFDTVIAMLDAHVSQVYEWIPHTLDRSASVPANPVDRRVWLAEFHRANAGRVARRFAPAMRLAEAFELSEYGRRPRPEEIGALFPQAIR